jgi:hypothetical protein
LKLHEVGKSRLLCFDLENRPLAYWYDGETTSQITAFGWKWRDEPDAHSLLLTKEGRFVGDDGRTISERAAYTAFHLTLSNADIVYGHNIRRHDLPMFQAWLLRLQMPTLPPILTSDTLRDIPKRNGLSASLENLAAMYGLEGEKYTMNQPAWEKANTLTRDGLALARRRVVSDVLLQERLRDKLLELGLLGSPRTWRP